MHVDDEAVEAPALGRGKHAAGELEADALALPVVAHEQRHLGGAIVYGAEELPRPTISRASVSRSTTSASVRR